MATVGPLQLRQWAKDPEVDALVQKMRLNVPGGVTLELLKASIDDFLLWSDEFPHRNDEFEDMDRGGAAAGDNGDGDGDVDF